ncbi:MAG: hypothetical protein AB7I04_17925 [Pseudomonadales bacterium]
MTIYLACQMCRRVLPYQPDAVPHHCELCGSDQVEQLTDAELRVRFGQDRPREGREQPDEA